MVNSPENIGKAYSFGVEVMVGIDILRWWNVNVSTSIFSHQLHIDIENNKRKKSQFQTDSRLNNTFLLPKSFTIKWDVHYNSPQIKTQEHRDGYLYSNFALKKGFKNNKWQIILAYSNLFNSIKFNTTTYDDDFSIEKRITSKAYASLKIAYKFNNQK